MKKMREGTSVPLPTNAISYFLKDIKGCAVGADMLADRMFANPRINQFKFGLGKNLADWIFAEYGGDIVSKDKKCMVRFASEDNLLFFMMRFG